MVTIVRAGQALVKEIEQSVQEKWQRILLQRLADFFTLNVGGIGGNVHSASSLVNSWREDYEDEAQWTNLLAPTPNLTVPAPLSGVLQTIVTLKNAGQKVAFVQGEERKAIGHG